MDSITGLKHWLGGGLEHAKHFPLTNDHQQRAHVQQRHPTATMVSQLSPGLIYSCGGPPGLRSASFTLLSWNFHADINTRFYT